MSKMFGSGTAFTEKQCAMMEEAAPEGFFPARAFNYRGQFVPKPDVPDAFKGEDLPSDLQAHGLFAVRYIDRETNQGAWIEFDEALHVPADLAENVQFMASFAEQAVSRVIAPSTEIFIEVLGILIQGIGNTLFRNVQEIADTLAVFSKDGKFGAMKHAVIYRTLENKLQVLARAY